MTSARANRRRRGWQVLVWGLMFFAGIQAAASAVMERWQPGLRDREYGVKLARLRERLAERGRHPLVLVLGSSRVAVGLRTMQLRQAEDPRVPLVFNVGIRGGGPLMELMTLQRLFAEGVKPDCIVFEYWPCSCYREEDRMAACRLGWADGLLLLRYSDQPAEFARRWLQERLLPCYSSRFTILNQIAPNLVAANDGWDRRLDGGGWRPTPIPRNREHAEELLKKAWTMHGPNLKDFRLPETSERAMRDALTLCRQRGIRTAVLFMPESKGFQPCYPPEVWEQVETDLYRLAGESGTVLINCRDWMEDEDFADGFHLLPTGAD